MPRSEIALKRSKLRPRGQWQNGGFSLIETLMALCVSCLMGTVMLNAFRWQMQIQKQSLQQMREKEWRNRALDRIVRDVKNATLISTDPLKATPACNLENRTPVLHLTMTSSTITYSVGTAPSPLWRGTVLMRCARDPNGVITNRVLIDALAQSDDPPGRRLTDWTGCSTLLLQKPGTELAGSYKLPFSACIQTSNPKIGAVRLQLRNLRYTTVDDRQNSERQVFLDMS